MSRRGVILLAHGARDPRWSEPLEALAQRCASRLPGVPFVLAYLDAMSPDLAEAVDRLVRGGSTDLVVVPAFLGVGVHVRTDLPKLARAIAQDHPGVSIRISTALGEIASVQDAMAVAVAGVVQD